MLMATLDLPRNSFEFTTKLLKRNFKKAVSFKSTLRTYPQIRTFVHIVIHITKQPSITEYELREGSRRYSLLRH